MYFVDYDGVMSLIKPSGVIIILAIVLAIELALYILRGIGVYRLAKRENVKFAFLAFIPFLWIYPTAQIVKEVSFFGNRIKKIGIISLITFAIYGILFLFLRSTEYIPLTLYYLQGGRIIIYNNIDNVNYAIWATNSIGYICAPDIALVYTEGMLSFLKIINYVVGIIDIFCVVIKILVYIKLFNTYLPRRSGIASVFSVLGLFGPFVFAVRNNEKFDYEKFMRARYEAFSRNAYNNPNNPNGGEGFSNTNNPSSKGEEPFKDFESSDPFEEFSDKKDRK